MWSRTGGKIKLWKSGTTSFMMLLNQVSVDVHSYITLNTTIFFTHHITFLYNPKPNTLKYVFLPAESITQITRHRIFSYFKYIFKETIIKMYCLYQKSWSCRHLDFLTSLDSLSREGSLLWNISTVLKQRRHHCPSVSEINNCYHWQMIMKNIIIGVLVSARSSYTDQMRDLHVVLISTHSCLNIHDVPTINQHTKWGKRAVVGRYGIKIRWGEKEVVISLPYIYIYIYTFMPVQECFVPACLLVCHWVCASASSRALIMMPRLCAHAHTHRPPASHIFLTQCLTVPLTNQWHQTLACGSLIPVNVLLCNS